MNSYTALVSNDVPDATPIRPRHTELALSASLVLAAGYVLVLPAGRMGACLTLASLTVALAACNRDTLTAYLLLFGGAAFGPIAVWIGLPGFGGKVTGLMGLFLAISDRRFLPMIARLQRPLLWAAWVGAVLTAWFYMGPQTAYCQHVLVRYFMGVPVAMIGFAYLLWKPLVDWRVLGQVTLVSALATLAFGATVEPSLRPGHVLDVATIRQARSELSEEAHPPMGASDLAYMATMGAILMACASPDRPLGWRDRTRLSASLIMAAVVLGWAFNRLHLVAFVAAFGVAPFTGPRFKRRYQAIAVLSALLIGVAVVTAYMKEAGLVTRVLDTDSSVMSRLNRSTNWEAGIYCLRQKPWFGHGLGGYYIRGYSAPGEGTFAHNLVLELLTNLGLVGTGIAFAPVILLVGITRRPVHVRLRAASGAIAIPVLTVLFLDAMVSSHLGILPVVLAVLSLTVIEWPKATHRGSTP